MTFSERLKTLRKKSDETQEDIANILGIEQVSYSRYEIGKRKPDYNTLGKLADHWQVSVDYILDRTDDSTPSGVTTTTPIETRVSEIPE